MKNYALITGATSGIGYELAKLAAKDGYNLVLVARDGEELNKVKSEFEKYKITVKTIPCDLFDPNAAKKIYDETKSAGITVDILINDAGQGQHGKFWEQDLQRHLDIVQLNVSSLIALTHCFLKDMVSRNQGRILQLGSEVSKTPAPLLAVYAASKAFVLSFAEALINELKDTNVTMTVLMPGATDTDFFGKAGMEETKVYREEKFDKPEVVAELGYKAMMEGERRVVGPVGRKNVVSGTIMPDNVVAANTRKIMEKSDKDASEGRTAPEHQRSKEVKEKGDNKDSDPMVGAASS